MHAIASELYAAEVLIEPTKYAHFLTRDPPICWCVQAGSDVVGYFTLVPLDASTCASFGRQELSEHQLTQERVSELNAAVGLYVLEITSEQRAGAGVLRAFRTVAALTLQDWPNIKSVLYWPYSESGKLLSRLILPHAPTTGIVQLSRTDAMRALHELKPVGVSVARCSD